jgi:PTH1 family peptidyl-tRNA hydrolase
MFLIVGLGNPGTEYENTRHNLGFKVIEELARRLSIISLKFKSQSLIAEDMIKDHKVIIAEPQTYMNNSGPAVRGLMEWFKIKSENLILIYDDVDLEVGQLRIREKGGAGGHHGVSSVIESLGTTHFNRIRIGVGREDLSGDVSEYVLQTIPSSQREKIDETVIAAADAAESIIGEGLDKAMNRFNLTPGER